MRDGPVGLGAQVARTFHAAHVSTTPAHAAGSVNGGGVASVVALGVGVVVAPAGRGVSAPDRGAPSAEGPVDEHANAHVSAAMQMEKTASEGRRVVTRSADARPVPMSGSRARGRTRRGPCVGCVACVACVAALQFEQKKRATAVAAASGVGPLAHPCETPPTSRSGAMHADAVT